MSSPPETENEQLLPLESSNSGRYEQLHLLKAKPGTCWRGAARAAVSPTAPLWVSYWFRQTRKKLTIDRRSEPHRWPLHTSRKTTKKNKYSPHPVTWVECLPQIYIYHISVLCVCDTWDILFRAVTHATIQTHTVMWYWWLAPACELAHDESPDGAETGCKKARFSMLREAKPVKISLAETRQVGKKKNNNNKKLPLSAELQEFLS